MQIPRLRTALWAIAALGISAPMAAAEPMTVTDIAGRSVTLANTPQRIILGEGRMMYAIAPLATDDPFEHIVGWKDDLILYDPDAFRRFEAAFPQDTARMVNFGNPYSGDFSIEAVLENKADLLLFDLGNRFKAKETGLIKKLYEAGIPVLFIDFRQSPTVNTVPSMLLLGRVLGEDARTAGFIDFYISEMRKVTNIMDKMPGEDRPLVFIENAAGWTPDSCCATYASFNYGRYVELAGGGNYGSELSSGVRLEVSLEAVITADPDILIGNGAKWVEARPEVQTTLLGYEGDPANNEARLVALSRRNGFDTMRAVEQGRMHTIYHQFYNSPYHFVAIQPLAKWIQPDAFAGLDPQATFDELHKRFMPFEAGGQFWVSLSR